MTRQIQIWVKETKNKYILKSGNVLEIGSYDVNGGVKQFFSDAEKYIGIDMTPGPGVDKVLNSHDLLKEFKENSFDVVLCLEALEHDDQFWVSVENMKKVLKPGGFLLISTPTYGFPVHRFPKDYYRFNEEVFTDYLFKGLKLLDLCLVFDDSGYPGLCGAGQKL